MTSAGKDPAHFAKHSEDEPLAAEAEGLEALRATGTVRVPDFIRLEKGKLVLERLELHPLNAASATRLGIALAQLHRIEQPKFGWEKDNFIGASAQANGWSDDWLGFWREKRLQPQLRMAAAKRYPSRMIDRGERLLADCGEFFRNHSPHKSLLHGDLWGGNAGALPDGTPVIFDPAVYVGDREADLAMTELFGGFPADFRDAYRNAWPLADGYSERREFYNLYHVLNHANLFSGGYVRQAEQLIEKILAELS